MKLAVAVLAAALVTQARAESPIQQALQAPDRPSSDTGRDTARHTAELLALAGIKPGDRVADFVPGGGYFTRLFSHLVGPQGHVFAIVPSELAAAMPKMPAGIAALAAQPVYGNVTLETEPTAQTGAAAIVHGGELDLIWTSDNYHDLYGFFGPAAAAAADAAIFRALKPGGTYIVVDHTALAGASATAPQTLHRIDPATVRAQVLAAGFVLDASSDVLRNPADPHTDKVFAPAIKGHTDQFVFRFRKPAH